MLSRLAALALLACLALTVPSAADAQPVGSLAGSVADRYGDPLPGVAVEVVSVSGYRLRVVSDSFGR